METDKKETCALCHKKSEDYIKEIKCVEDILDVLNLPLNTGPLKSNSLFLCKSCVRNLKQIQEFKSKCLDINDKIVSVSQGTKMYVHELYAKAFIDTSIPDISTDQNICRVCMKAVDDGKLVPLNAENVDSTLLGKYFPELDLTLTEDPEICPPCLKSLQQYLHDIDHYVNILKDAKGDDLNKIKDSTSSDKEEFLSEQKAASSKSRNLRKRKRVSINEKASDEGKFQCAHCAYEATTRSRILRHLLKHRESDLNERKIPKLTCDQCGFQCRSADMFKGHIRSHQIPSTKSKTKCGECSFQSNWAQNLRRHQLTHLKDFPTEMIMYKCKICQYKSRRKYLVKEHVLTHNVGSGDGNEEDDPQNTSGLIEVVKYQCDICENQCENNVEFEEHMKGHKLSSDNSTYKCHLCSYTTRIKQKLKVHMVVHKSISEVTHLCHICAFKTKRKGDLKVHVLSHNNKDRQTSDGIKLNEHKLVGRNPPKTKLYRCKECSFGGRNHYSLLKHKIAAHNTVLEQYQCDRCNYSTHIKSIFKRHTKTHENISATYKCNICSFNTSNKNKLRQHISNDHGDEKYIEQFSCQHCRYWINCRETFERHLLQHNKKPGLLRCCDVCSYKTCYKSRLDRHMLTHKPKGEVLSCEHCQYRAEDQDDFSKHVSQHEIDMKHSCTECSYKTSRRIYLEHHMSTHKLKKKRVFVARVSECEICKYQSTISSYMQRHMFRKHKDMVNDESFKIVEKFLPVEKFENAYNCEFCDYKTVVKFRFLRHMKVHKVDDDGVKGSVTEVTTSPDDTITIVKHHVEEYSEPSNLV